jgi:hypothetical protein
MFNKKKVVMMKGKDMKKMITKPGSKTVKKTVVVKKKK